MLVLLLSVGQVGSADTSSEALEEGGGLDARSSRASSSIAGESWDNLTFLQYRAGFAWILDPTNGDIYLFGGRHRGYSDHGEGYEDDLWRYNLTADEWVLLNDGEGPSKRGSSQLAIDPQGKRLFLFGGIYPDVSAHQDLWMYEILNDRWSMLIYDWDPSYGGVDCLGYADGYVYGWYPGFLGTGTWELITYQLGTGRVEKKYPSNSPSPSRRWEATTFDMTHKRFFVFGGREYYAGSWHTYGDNYVLHIDNLSWEKLASFPGGVGRYQLDMAYDRHEDAFYTYGGAQRDVSVTGDDDLWAYYYGNNTWVRLQDGAPPGKEHLSELLYDPVNDILHMYTFWHYTRDPYPNIWKCAMGDLEWELNNLDPFPIPLQHHTMMETEDELVLFGGQDTYEWRTYGDLLHYDKGSGLWEHKELPDALSGRNLHASAQDPDGERFFVYGGVAYWDDLKEDLWEYNVSTRQWTNMTVPGEGPRVLHAAMAYCPNDPSLYVFGGWNPSTKAYTSELWRFNLTSRSWTLLRTGGPNPRGNATMVYNLASHSLCLFGGRGPTTSYADLRVFDIAKGTWSYLNPATAGPEKRSLHDAVYVPLKNLMVVYGGSNQYGNPLGDLWVYHFSEDEWYQEDPSNSPGPRSGHRICVSSTSKVLFLQGGSVDDNSVWFLDMDISPVAFGPKMRSTMAKEDKWFDLAFFTIGDPITEWRVETSREWLEWNVATHNLSGIPRNVDVGTTHVKVNATNGRGDYDEHSFDIIVENTPPEILGEDVLVAVEDVEYIVDYDCTDDGSGDITWTLTSAAEHWLSIDGESGVLRGTPDDAAVGNVTVMVSVSDGHDEWVRHRFELEVLNVNDPPTIVTEDVDLVNEDEQYAVNYIAQDPDPTEDTLVWRLSTDADFLRIDPARGTLSGTPDNGDVGSYWVNVSVTDGIGGHDHSNFTLTVVNVNDPPVILRIGSTPADLVVLIEINEGDELVFEIVVEDLDGDDLSYGLPSPFDWVEALANGTLVVSPPVGTEWTFWGNLTVEDGNGGTDVVELKIVVSDINFPPVILDPPVGVVEAYEDIPFSMMLVAEDADGDKVMWLDDSVLFEIDADTGVIAFTPAQADVGTYNVEIKVGDGNGGITTLEMVLEVVNVNDPPMIQRLEPESGSRYKKGKGVPFKAHATDEDGDSLEYRWKLGEEILGTGDELLYKGLGRGTHVVTLEVSDGTDVTSSDVEVVVEAVKEDGSGPTGLMAILAILVTSGLARAKIRSKLTG